MLEEKIEALIGALEANTEALLAGGNTPTRSVDDIKKSIGESEKAMQDEEPAPKPVSKKKASKKKARNTKPSVTIEKVKEALTVLDRESAKAVLKTFKVTKLSELKPEDFQAAIDEADQYVGEVEEPEDDLFD